MTDIDEIKLWEWCKTHGDYSGYLMRYPNGSYATEAREKIETGNEAVLPQTPQIEPADTVLISWKPNKEVELEGLKKCRSIEDYEAFLSKYPFGNYADVAKNIIKKLEELQKEREEKDRVRQEIWRKERKDEDDLKKCQTIEDFQRFIETHPGSKSLKAVQTHLEALKAEPKQLTVFLICNSLGIIALILGLYFNIVLVFGLTSLILGVIEGLLYVACKEKWQYYNLDEYLMSGAMVSFLVGFFTCVRLINLS